jgi:hypothetical protein
VSASGGGDGDRKPPSMNRIAIWVIVGAVGAYFLVSGVIALFTGGS